MSSSKYLMEDPREARRLADKVDPNDWVNRYLAPLIAKNSIVVDVGCGPGVILAEAARLNPDCTFLGIDGSKSRVDEANLRLSSSSNARAEVGDATRLPFSDGSCNLIYCRFLLEYLAKPEAALAEFKRVLARGGLMLLQDLDGQLVWHYPEDQSMKSSVETVLSSLAQTGFDPFIGRKLFYMLHRIGMEDIGLKCEPYHFFPGKIDPHNEQLWTLKLDIATPAIAAALGSLEAAQEFKMQFMNYLRRPDTLTFSLVFTAVARET